MIQFPCKCGHLFNLMEDQAGGLTQCPRCGLLVDIPTMDDAGNLNPDGTYAFEELTVVEDPVTAAELHGIYTTRTKDEQGHEKDLRPTLDHFDLIGVIEHAKPERVAPRYDPETGELIRPLQLKDERPTPVIPIVEPSQELAISPAPAYEESLAPSPVFKHVPAPQPVVEMPPAPLPVIPAPSLGYAVGPTRRPSHYPPAIDLLMPGNVAVMCFVFLFYVAAYLAKIPLNTFAIYFSFPTAYALIPNFLLYLILAHYGCVVEDIGPDAMDEVPRPLRHLAFTEDLFNPLFRVLLALTICFLPAVMVLIKMNMTAGAGVAIEFAFIIAGCVLFPAVVLTTLTGVTILNLTPPRILSVISISGARYLLCFALFCVSLFLTTTLLLGPSTIPALANFPGIHLTLRISVLIPGIMLAIYITHLFAWQLGLMYREHYDEYPWLAQRHVRVET